MKASKEKFDAKKCNSSILDLPSLKIVYLIIFVSFIYEVIYANQELTYFEQFLAIRTDMIDLFFVFLSYSLCIFITFKEISKDLSTFIRLGSRKKYVDFILKNEIKFCFIVFLINLLKSLIVVNLFSWHSFEITASWYSGLNIVWYIILNTFKHFVLLNVFVVIITLIVFCFNYIIGCFSSVLISILLFFNPEYENNVLLNFYDYFNYTNLLKQINYSNGLLGELLHFFVYIFVCLFVIYCLYNYVVKTRKKGVLE